MATNPIEKELFPFSTEDGKSIPLDIIRPLSLIPKLLTNNLLTAITIPATWKAASFYSDVGCTIRFAGNLTNPMVDGVEVSDTLWLPPGAVVVSTVLAGVASILPAGNGYLKAQQIQKWSGLALRRQSSSI